jgi:hypothetical protein
VSYSRLAFNALLAVVVVGIAGFYRWHKSTLATAIKSDTIKLSVSDMLALMAICGGGLIYWQVMNQRSLNAHALAEKIFQQQGMAHVTPVLPSFLKDRAPDFILKMHERIVAVELNSPDNELLQQVVAEPYLQKLSVTGNNFDAERLTPIATNPRIWSLRISGRQLTTPDELQFVGTMSQLSAINLMRTTITSSALNQWKGLSRIRFMHLVHTDLVLSELSNPPWANQVQTLFLPRPPRGIGDSFEIDGWSNLKDLRLFEFEELVNDNVLVLSLSNLPSLQEVTIENFQKADLYLNNVPLMEAVGSARNMFLSDQWEPRLGNSPYGPGTTWLRKLIVQNAPKLNLAYFFAGELEECSLTGVSSDFTLKAHSSVYSKDNYSRARLNAIPYLKRSQTIKALANCEAIHSLELFEFNGYGIKFDALAKAPNLASISFEKCNIDKSQILQLAGSESLQSLTLDSDQLDGASLNFLLKRLPKLSQLKLRDCDLVNSLRLESHPLARIASESGVFNLSALRLIDLPHFESVIGVKHPIKHLHISNVPKLRGIVVQGPLPSDRVLEITPAIEVLGLGGPSVSDESLLPFSEMKKLRKLSLIDTSLSESRLLEIGEANDLNALVVAGDNLTETVATRIVTLKGLQKLELVTNNNLSNGVFDGIGKLSELRYLILRCKAPEASDYSWLSKLERLEMVRFDGWRCTPELLNSLSGLKNLACVAFENTDLSKSDLETIGNRFGESFIRLGLQRSTVDFDGLRFVMAQRPSVAYELRDAKVDNRLISEAMKSNRLFTSYSDESFLFEANNNLATRNSFSYGQQEKRVDAEWDTLDPELIDSSIFRSISSTQSSRSTKARGTSPLRTPAGEPKSGVDSSSTPPQDKKSDWLDLLDQLGK